MFMIHIKKSVYRFEILELSQNDLSQTFQVIICNFQLKVRDNARFFHSKKLLKLFLTHQGLKFTLCLNGEKEKQIEQDSAGNRPINYAYLVYQT